MSQNFNDKVIREAAGKLQKAMNTTVMKDARNMGVTFFKQRFRSQGWLDKGYHPWPKRKKEDKKRPGRNILMDRGTLRNSIRGEVKGTDIVFGSDVVYAKVHNEGGTITIPPRTQKITFKRYSKGKHKGKQLFAKNNKNASFSQKVQNKGATLKMPKRQFMGESHYLNIKVKGMINKTIQNIFR